MNTEIHNALCEHKFFKDLDDADIAAIANYGRLRDVDAGVSLAIEGDTADCFFALLDGRVAIDTNVPGRPPITLQTVAGGDVIGWSWVGSHEWVFDVRTLAACRLVELDADKVMHLMEEKPKLGMEIMRRLNHVMTQRLRATRLQLLDIYGEADAND